jgi:predicted metal-dependent enzyme (double-stranded beta helix superfamily)
METLDVDAFVADCLAAAAEDEPVAALREVVQRAVADPAAVERSLGTSVSMRTVLLHRSPGLTVHHLVMPPGYATGIHDHRMPAVIGTWGGYEDNAFYRRRGGGALEPAGGTRSVPGDVLVLGDEAIHEVSAPSTRWTAGLHVYLGDLRAAVRSQWPQPPDREEPYDGEAVVRQWQEALAASGMWAC